MEPIAGAEGTYPSTFGAKMLAGRSEKRMSKILIVEDDAGLRQGLDINLRLENHETVQAADGEQAIEMFHAHNPDLVLLDLMLPKKSGFEVLDHIRKYSKVPVILLTARGAETDKVRGLRGGADDYVTKPFGLQELFARIDAVIRRSEVQQKAVFEDELIRLDPSTREAQANGKDLKLSPKGFSATWSTTASGSATPTRPRARSRSACASRPTSSCWISGSPTATATTCSSSCAPPAARAPCSSSARAASRPTR